VKSGFIVITSLYSTFSKVCAFGIQLRMDHLLHTVNCAVFAESFSWWWHWGVGISLFQISVDSIQF